jgi:hypothetical protein
MMIRRLFFVLIPVVTLCGYAVRAEKDEFKSGPQAGDNLPGPFLSLVTNSSDDPGLVGKKTDFLEKYGADPAVLVFAQEMTEPLTGLVKKLDAEVAKNKSAKLRAVVVFLSDDEALEKNLKDYGEKQGIKNVNVAIMEPEGPKNYKLAKEAQVTVVIYKKRRVEANHAFAKGKLNDMVVERILADTAKLVSDK